MLVLARKSRESIVIAASDNLNELVRVTVLDVRDGNVKLGFQAEKDVAIHRQEVWARVRAENHSAIPLQQVKRPK